jgi:biopolymer transport protein ExbD
MAGADLGAPKSAGKGKKKHKQKKRLNVRIDMTPMVDVVMLLITFFMLTTVFNTPQTMEINLPPDEKTEVEVAESSLLQVRVLADGSIYWNMGMEPAHAVAFKDLHKLFVERLQANPKIICLVKLEREGTYKMMVDIMDELNLANISRFSFAPFKEFDKKFIAKAS